MILLNNFANQGATLRGFEDGAKAGRSVGGAGDINGDGFADLIVGAVGATAGGTSRGAAYVVLGGPNLGGATVILNVLGPLLCLGAPEDMEGKGLIYVSVACQLPALAINLVSQFAAVPRFQTRQLFQEIGRDLFVANSLSEQQRLHPVAVPSPLRSQRLQLTRQLPRRSGSGAITTP